MIGAFQDPLLMLFGSKFHIAGKTSKGYSTGTLRKSNRELKVKVLFFLFFLLLLANSAPPSEITDCVQFCRGFVLSAPPPLCCRATCRCVPPRCVRQPPPHPASLYLWAHCSVTEWKSCSSENSCPCHAVTKCLFIQPCVCAHTHAHSHIHTHHNALFGSDA